MNFIRDSFVKIASKDIVKVFSLTTISTIIRMLTGLLSVKVISVIIGPAGIALLGQLNNFTSIVMSVASGGINNGVTKYIAEFKESKEETPKLLSTAFKITITCSLLAGILTIFFHDYLSQKILNNHDYGYIFLIFGSTSFLNALNMLFTSIINGFKEYKKYIYVNIAGSLFGLVFTLILIYTLHLKGALISAVTFQSVVFFITIYICRKSLWLTKENFFKKYNGPIAKKYFKYTIMALVTAIAMPLSQFFLRSEVISTHSLFEAGWWEAMNRISAMYLMVITTSFSVYYLPRLSEIKSENEIRKEVLSAYRVIIPSLLILFTSIYILKTYIVKLLFSNEFLPMQDLFFWQLLGDFFKISSWLLAFIMIAKSMTKIYIFTELISACSFIVISLFLLQKNNIVGLTQGYALNYFIYLLYMTFVFRKIIFHNENTSNRRV